MFGVKELDHQVNERLNNCYLNLHGLITTLRCEIEELKVKHSCPCKLEDQEYKVLNKECVLETCSVCGDQQTLTVEEWMKLVTEEN